MSVQGELFGSGETVELELELVLVFFGTDTGNGPFDVRALVAFLVIVLDAINEKQSQM